jgi:lipoprotein-anchoring transpeptidase ErfK/SrfK
MAEITRREFIKNSTTLLSSFLIFPGMLHGGFKSIGQLASLHDQENTLGRVTAGEIVLYEQPSKKARMIKTLHFDNILPITGSAISPDDNQYNRIWYELDGQGFAYSGSVQPVKEILNTSVQELESTEMLAEVTIPFTDGLWSANRSSSRAYRLYYGSVYWIDKVTRDGSGNYWYRVNDEEDYTYYVDSSHMHLIQEAELTPISSNIPAEHKKIVVHLKEQTVIAYEYEKPVLMTRVATGATYHADNTLTPRGQFITNRKRPSRHMKDPMGSSYDLPGVPWVSYITESGVAFHGTYWHNDFGHPRSHGCINMSNEAARWLYRWTTPAVPFEEKYLEEQDGTRVDVA